MIVLRRSASFVRFLRVSLAADRFSLRSGFFVGVRPRLARRLEPHALERGLDAGIYDGSSTIYEAFPAPSSDLTQYLATGLLHVFA